MAKYEEKPCSNWLAPLMFKHLIPIAWKFDFEYTWFAIIFDRSSAHILL